MAEYIDDFLGIFQEERVSRARLEEFSFAFSKRIYKRDIICDLLREINEVHEKMIADPFNKPAYFASKDKKYLEQHFDEPRIDVGFSHKNNQTIISGIERFKSINDLIPQSMYTVTVVNNGDLIYRYIKFYHNLFKEEAVDPTELSDATVLESIKPEIDVSHLPLGATETIYKFEGELDDFFSRFADEYLTALRMGNTHRAVILGSAFDFIRNLGCYYEKALEDFQRRLKERFG